ncbi:MAG: isoprenylcysteine carboxylmethyltransferase family protein [Pseudomonadota bacterium]
MQPMAQFEVERSTHFSKGEMDTLRMILGVGVVVILPVVLAFWITIHGGSRFWRSQKPVYAYSAALLAMLLAGGLAAAYRATLVGVDLGGNIVLFGLGAIVYGLSFLLWRPIKKALDFSTFAGVPEVSGKDIALIQTGPFKLVRHPRYLMVAIGLIGWALMANYAGVYFVGLLSLAGLAFVVRLEERDLTDRFGSAYRDYQKQVPQLVPTLASWKAYRDG